MKKTITYLSLLVVITTAWFPSILISAEFEKYPQRMALAISGGASKGAYEA